MFITDINKNINYRVTLYRLYTSVPYYVQFTRRHCQIPKPVLKD